MNVLRCWIGLKLHKILPYVDEAVSDAPGSVMSWMDALKSVDAKAFGSQLLQLAGLLLRTAELAPGSEEEAVGALTLHRRIVELLSLLLPTTPTVTKAKLCDIVLRGAYAYEKTAYFAVPIAMNYYSRCHDTLTSSDISITAEPKYASLFDHHVHLACKASSLDKPEPVFRYLQQVVEIARSAAFPQALASIAQQYFRLGSALYKQRQFESALLPLQQSCTLLGGDWTHCERTWTHEEAVSLSKRFEVLSRCQSSVGQHESARASVAQAVLLLSDSPELRMPIMQRYVEQHMPVRNSRQYRSLSSAVADHSNVDCHLLSSIVQAELDILLEKGARFETLLPLTEQLVGVWSKQHPLRRARAVICQVKLLLRAPDQTPAQKVEGRIAELLQLCKQEDLVSDVELAPTRLDLLATAYSLQAVYAFRNGTDGSDAFGLALTTYKLAMKGVAPYSANPEACSCYLNIASAYLQMGYTAEAGAALGMCRGILERRDMPDAIETRYLVTYATYLAHVGNLAKSEKVLHSIRWDSLVTRQDTSALDGSIASPRLLLAGGCNAFALLNVAKGQLTRALLDQTRGLAFLQREARRVLTSHSQHEQPASSLDVSAGLLFFHCEWDIIQHLLSALQSLCHLHLASGSFVDALFFAKQGKAVAKLAHSPQGGAQFDVCIAQVHTLRRDFDCSLGTLKMVLKEMQQSEPQILCDVSVAQLAAADLHIRRQAFQEAATALKGAETVLGKLRDPAYLVHEAATPRAQKVLQLGQSTADHLKSPKALVKLGRTALAAVESELTCREAMLQLELGQVARAEESLQQLVDVELPVAKEVDFSMCSAQVLNSGLQQDVLSFHPSLAKLLLHSVVVFSDDLAGKKRRGRAQDQLMRRLLSAEQHALQVLASGIACGSPATLHSVARLATFLRLCKMVLGQQRGADSDVTALIGYLGAVVPSWWQSAPRQPDLAEPMLRLALDDDDDANDDDKAENGGSSAVSAMNAASLPSTYGYEKVLGRWQDILAGNNASIQQGKQCLQPTDKAEWWATRRRLDKGLQTLLKETEYHPCTQEDAADLVHYMLDMARLCDGGDSLEVERADVNKIIEQTAAFLSSFVVAAQDTLQPFSHIVLVLDRHLQQMPLESMPVLRAAPAVRVPSLAFLYDRLARRSGSVSFECDASSAAYVLNPSGDLSSTQTTFDDALSKYDSPVGISATATEPLSCGRHTEWYGIVGRPPTAQEFTAGLTQHELFLYFGHGAGEAFLSGHKVRRVAKCAVTILMGCSSGALRDAGDFDPHGMSVNYMVNGCPALVANLWDVTDRDIDRFSMTAMEKWGLLIGGDDSAVKERISLVQAVAASRDACVLPYLVGAAPVVYGVPVYLRTTTNEAHIQQAAPGG
ncbi:separin protein [Sorochytrium milnesiophthora]